MVKMAKFDERVILVLAVVGLFAAQLSIVGYQVLTCNAPAKGNGEYCLKRNEDLAKASDSAANVFLALLVPAAYVASKSRSKEGGKDS
jgi:hypothetical protein